MATDPWYDYLALPAAPAVLLVQAFALSLPSPWRQGVALAGTAAIAAMLVFVWTLDTGDTGANIGGGLLVIALLVSLALAARALTKSDRRGVSRPGSSGSR